MDESQKMMKMIIGYLSAFKQEMMARFDKFEKRLDHTDKEVSGLKYQIKDVESRLTKRTDSLGKQLAVIDDGAPTGEEFEDLKRRVTVVERKVVLAVNG